MLVVSRVNIGKRPPFMSDSLRSSEKIHDVLLFAHGSRIIRVVGKLDKL
jgi:hypothetical protein